MFTVVAMEVLMKYCVNSFPRVDEFIRWKIDQLPSVYFMCICDWSIRPEVKCNWLSG